LGSESTNDPRTFERLVAEHLDRALSLAIRLTGRVPDAEDIMQDALLKATQHWPSYRWVGPFDRWLMRIVINTFRDHLSRRRVGQPLDQTWQDVRATNPATASEQHEIAAEVARAVSQLPPRQREVIVLTVYEQMSAREAAEMLSTTEANVRVNLHHARANLRQRLRRHMEA
jgi:RNA polymerase sigma-70 factor, ECF subfamily